MAAVIGRRAPHRLLAAVAGLDERRLDEALREAVAGKLLVTRPGDDGYEFRHALLREVAYADLLPGERARLHGEVAAAIAAHPGWAGGTDATVAAELANHWDAAGDAERALPAAVEAGDQAERGYAFAEAQRHLERALELWPEVPRAAELTGLDRVGLLDRAAAAAHLAEDDARAVQLLRQALDGVDPAGDPVRAGALQERLGRSLWLTLDDGALAAYQEAVRLVPAEPPSAERARVLAGYVQLLLLQGRSRHRSSSGGRGGAGHRPPGRGTARGGTGPGPPRRHARRGGPRAGAGQSQGGPSHRRRAGRRGRVRLGQPAAGRAHRSTPAGSRRRWPSPSRTPRPAAYAGSNWQVGLAV